MCLILKEVVDVPDTLKEVVDVPDTLKEVMDLPDTKGGSGSA